MDKFARMALLYDFYSPLLTGKQRESLNLYYQQDLSLSEIAEESGISRQAVHDLLKRTEKILVHYEQVLHLVDKHLEQQAKITEIKNLLTQIPGQSETVHRINVLINELAGKD